jgi:hypothetical protein
MPTATETKLAGSVGRQGLNKEADVKAVQELLNARIPIPMAFVDVTGVCDDQTIAVIEEIQRRYLKDANPDGRVDPRGRTLKFLDTGIAEPKPAATGAARFPSDLIAGAQLSQKNTGIPASVTLAQWALESGWGKAMPEGSNNPFGIKAVEGQPYVESKTREVFDGKEVFITARFRKFSSMAEAFDLHGQLLAKGAAYAHARSLLPDADKFADALTGVYATDPNYGKILKQIMKANNLYQYDK